MSRKWQFIAGVFLAVALLIPLMGGCAAPAPAPAPVEEAAPTYQYSWRMNQPNPEGSAWDIAATAFVKDVKEGTEGRIDITIYPAGQLGDWIEVYERIMRGDYNLSITPLPPTYDPRMNVAYYMPYMFTTTAQAKDAYGVGGWVYNMINDLLADQNIKGLALWPSGWAGASFKEEPEGWREMKPSGVKMRTMPIKACEWAWETLGYTCSSLGYNEIYTAIERGIVDAQCGGPPEQGWHFREVQGCWIKYNDYLEPIWFFMNLDDWNSLTGHDQEVLVQAAEKQALARWGDFLADGERYCQKMADEGMTIITPTEAELQKFADAVRADVWPKLEGLMGKSIVNYCRQQVGMPVA